MKSFVSNGGGGLLILHEIFEQYFDIKNRLKANYSNYKLESPQKKKKRKLKPTMFRITCARGERVICKGQGSGHGTGAHRPQLLESKQKATTTDWKNPVLYPKF